MDSFSRAQYYRVQSNDTPQVGAFFVEGFECL